MDLSHEPMIATRIPRGCGYVVQEGPVFNTMVIVAIQLLMVGSVAGCIDESMDGPSYHYEIAAEISSILSYRLNNSRFWEVNGPITIYREIGRNNWSSLTVSIWTGYSSRPENFTFGPRPVGTPSTLHFYFIDVNGDPSRPDVGDIIGAIGLSRKHQGVTFGISGRGVSGRMCNLDEWNETFTMSLAKGPTMIPRWPGQLPNVTIEVESTVPDWERIGWSDIRCQIEAKRLYSYGPILPSPLDGAQNVTAGIYYKETGTPDGLVDPGETIRLVYMPEAWFGKDLVLSTGPVEISRRALPEYFTE